MATSGSTDFNLTRDDIIIGALRLLGKAGRGKTPSSADTADAAQALELMVKNLQATGIHLWKKQQATLFVQKGTASYSLPGWHCTQSYVSTEVKVAGVATDLTIDVDSITGISDAGYIGIQLDSGTMHWTTVNGVPAGDTVAITDALPNAVAIDNTVYAYTTQLVRPLKALSARRIGTNDVDIEIVTHDEYFTLPTKTATGEVNQLFYDPQLTTAKVYIWPTGNAADDKIEITFMMPIEDFDSSGNNPDFPQEWLLALKYGLASTLGPEYGLELKRQMYIDQKASSYMIVASGFDEEVGSVYFTAED